MAGLCGVSVRVYMCPTASLSSFNGCVCVVSAVAMLLSAYCSVVLVIFVYV